MGDAEYVANQHICVGPIFVLFELFSYLRAANLVLHKLHDPRPVSFPFQQRDRFLTDVCTGLPPFSLFNLQSGWIASLHYFPPLLSSLNHVLDSCSSPLHPSFLFEPRPRFDYRSKKIHMQLEQRRFQRNLYLLGSSGCGKACGRRPDLPTLRTAARKKGSVALPHRRWVKEKSAAGSGFPPSPKAIE